MQLGSLIKTRDSGSENERAETIQCKDREREYKNSGERENSGVKAMNRDEFFLNSDTLSLM